MTLQRSAVSCSRKPTPRLVAHAGTTEQAVFVPIPFPPFWLLFTGHKRSDRLAQEVGALNFILHVHCCSGSHTKAFHQRLLGAATENGADGEGPRNKVKTLISEASTLTKYLIAVRHCSGVFLHYPLTPVRTSPPIQQVAKWHGLEFK